MISLAYISILMRRNQRHSDHFSHSEHINDLFVSHCGNILVTNTNYTTVGFQTSTNGKAIQLNISYYATRTDVEAKLTDCTSLQRKIFGLQRIFTPHDAANIKFHPLCLGNLRGTANQHSIQLAK